MENKDNISVISKARSQVSRQGSEYSYASRYTQISKKNKEMPKQLNNDPEKMKQYRKECKERLMKIQKEEAEKRLLEAQQRINTLEKRRAQRKKYDISQLVNKLTDSPPLFKENENERKNKNKNKNKIKPKLIDANQPEEDKFSKVIKMNDENKSEIEEVEEEENKEISTKEKQKEIDETYKRLEGLDLNVSCSNSIKKGNKNKNKNNNKNKITEEASPIEKNNELLDSLDLDTGVFHKMKQKYSKEKINKYSKKKNTEQHLPNAENQIEECIIEQPEEKIEQSDKKPKIQVEVGKVHYKLQKIRPPSQQENKAPIIEEVIPNMLIRLPREKVIGIQNSENISETNINKENRENNKPFQYAQYVQKKSEIIPRSKLELLKNKYRSSSKSNIPRKIINNNNNHNPNFAAFSTCTRDDNFDINEFIMEDLKNVNNEEKEIQNEIVQMHINNDYRKNQIYEKNKIDLNANNSKQLCYKLMGKNPPPQRPQNNQNSNEDDLLESINNLDYMLVQHELPPIDKKKAFERIINKCQRGLPPIKSKIGENKETSNSKIKVAPGINLKSMFE